MNELLSIVRGDRDVSIDSMFYRKQVKNHTATRLYINFLIADTVFGWKVYEEGGMSFFVPPGFDPNLPECVVCYNEGPFQFLPDYIGDRVVYDIIQATLEQLDWVWEKYKISPDYNELESILEFALKIRAIVPEEVG